MEEERTGIRKDIEELKKAIEVISEENKPKEKKVKEYKIPWSKKVNKAQAKKNWVTVLEINENRNGAFKKYPIEDQTVIIDGVPRLATADNVIMIGKNPTLILPKWSVKPISPSDEKYEYMDFSKSYEEIEKKGLNVKGYKVLMDRMKKEAISAKKNIPIWIWLVVLAGIGVAVYFLMNK